jgi:hypothetical protein
MVSISGNYHSVGQQFAGRRITLRLEASLGHVIIDRVLTRTIPLTPDPTQRARIPAPAPQLDQRPAWVQGTVTYHLSHNDTHHVEPRHGKCPIMHVRSCAVGHAMT